jgi:serine/threonine protein kinase/tetratricopeptide (TPR) repeat protein
MDLPRRFGRYELLEHIASGGMAEVFLARSFGLEGFQKQLVIKRILPALASEPRFVAMFIKEAKITAGLSHPNIVQIFELGKASSDHYIAMEFLHGRDLARINRSLRRTGERMPLPLAVYVIASLLRGLAYAHALTDATGAPLNLVHRDVSPHNVLVGFLGEVKLLDFGIARLTSAEEQRRTGQVGGGKFAYMSPEQASGEPLDHRSDIFSAGIVLYELLIGERLFQHPDPEEKLQMVREARVPDPREKNPDIPQALWLILRRMLAADPADRYDRAETVEEDLWAFLFSHGMRADAAAMISFMAGLFPDNAQRRGCVDLVGLAEDVGRLGRDVSSPTRPDATISQDSGGHTARTGHSRTDGSGLRALRPGQRRTVTVLVAEITGFTELSARSEPSEIVRRHYQVLRRIRRIVDAYGGLLESFRDDTFVIFFGMARAREDDLERGLTCAISLQRLTQRLARQGMSLGLAIGVHLGEITIGHQADRRVRYLARGDTMKHTRRLCFEAEVGEILISDAAAGLTRGRYRLTDGPAFTMKGHRGVSVSHRLGRRTGSLVGSGRWLVRGSELEELQQALRALSEGQGGMMAITGEPGVGKSQFLREIARLARNRGVPCFASRALPFGGDSPLSPIRDLIAGVIGLEHEDDEEALHDRLSRLNQLRIDDSDLELIAALFGVRPRRKRRGAAARPEDMLRAAAILVRRLAEDQPLILALDKVHNLAPLARSLVGHVISSAAGAPVLFLLTSQQDISADLSVPTWVVNLTPLSRKLQADLAAELMGADRLHPELATLIASTAQGNPLHIELLAKALTNQIVIINGEAELTEDLPNLPPGMDGLIVARLDALDPESRLLLQVAATIGVSFPIPLVLAAAGIEDADTVLAEVERQGFIERESSAVGAFTSPLIWQVVRSAIVGARLVQHHQMVIEGMTMLYADNLDVHRVSYAMHHAAAEHYLDAARHALQASRALLEQNLTRPAADIASKGVSWAEEAMTRGESRSLCRALCSRLLLQSGTIHGLLGEHSAAESALVMAQDMAADVGDAEIEACSALELGRMYRAMGRTTVAGAMLEAALASSHAGTMVPTGEGGRSLSQAVAWRRQVSVEALELTGMLALDAGNSADAQQRFQLALTMAGSDSTLAARALLGLASGPIRAGDTAAALTILEEAADKAAQSADRILMGRIANNTGIVYYNARQYDEALEHFRRSVSLRQGLVYRIGVVVNYHNIGDAYLRMGDMGRAWAAFQRSRDLAREVGWDSGVAMNQIYIAFIEGHPRSTEEPGEDPIGRMEEAADLLARHSDVEQAVSAQWLLGRLLATRGEQERARRILQGALSRAVKIDIKPLIRDIEEALGELSAG